MANRNTHYANIFVSELIRAGLQAVCIAPGSRSTPLTLAFAEQANTSALNIYSHLDERSTAFFALGLAMATRKPVALVCTSGTAAANFYPAIIEAHQSRVPLIVLTADRPHELRHSGANQTIDQIKLYGDFVLWSVDAALPEANPPAVAVRNLRTLASRALAMANGHTNGYRKGVVHINMPFRKPLEPVPVEGDILPESPDVNARPDNQPFTQFLSPVIMPDDAMLNRLGALLQQTQRGIIVCGVNALSTPEDAYYLNQLAQHVGLPIFADPASGMRYVSQDANTHVMAAYDTFLLDHAIAEQKSDLILRFGNLPISKPLNDYLNHANSRHIHITSDGVWADDSHRTAYFIHANPIATLCQRLLQQLEPASQDNASWAQYWQHIEQTTWQTIDTALENTPFFDAMLLHDVLDHTPSQSVIFAGNSLPIRLLDQFGRPSQKDLHVYANRGASGIDGNISTALGLGAGHADKPLVAILGDITTYHDLNGLLAVRRCGVPITLIVINNDGGGIFHRLPIRDYDPAFTDYFITPHGLTFEHAAALYGLPYVRADTRSTFRQAFIDSTSQRQSILIEVPTNAQEDLRHRQAIIEMVRQQLKQTQLTF